MVLYAFNMRRFFFSLTFCSFLLIGGAFIFSTASKAKDDVVTQLLRIPAPPPPNPLVSGKGRRDGEFYSKRKAPPDDAPIADLMDYWAHQSSSHQDLRFSPKPSQRVLDRLRAEIGKDPKSIGNYLNIFNDSREGAEFVKGIYENWPDTKGEEGNEKEKIRTWLGWNSPQYASQIEKAASRAGERGEYVANHEQLISLAKLDWDAARPTVDRLYGDASQPTSRVMATWALYTHSLEEGSLGDIDRYRDELKAVVEDKKATPGMRDLALDALVKEKEWSGRDDWYFSLLEDETLADLRVNGSSYTGLTTLIIYSHPDKYADKMIELVKSNNPVVRRAAARNLSVILDAERPDVVKALLPWLSDPEWAADTNGSRVRLVQILQVVKIPESVPPLIAMLDEKEVYYVDANANVMANAANAASNAYRYRSVANAMAMAVNAAAAAANSAANAMANANVGSTPKGTPVTHYPRRNEAIRALGTQEDMRAVPALRRMLKEADEYMRSYIVKAILTSKGFTVAEQANGLETLARVSREQMDRVTAEVGPNANVAAMSNHVVMAYTQRLNEMLNSPQGLEYILGTELMQTREPGDALVREVIARITQLEKREPEIAETLRGVLLMWKGAAVNSLLIKDLRDGKSDVHAVVKLLSMRKELQEKHSGEIGDAAKGGPMQAAVAACIMESESEYASIMAGENAESKAALLGCARLIRAKLPVKDVAKYLSNADKRLAAAAESYLESEDSAEARNIVLSLHPNEAKIMGATTGFWPENSQATTSLGDLFASVSGDSTPNDRNAMIALASTLRSRDIDGEKSLRDEIKKDADLLGLYSFADNVIRIYKDKVAYTWGTDESRFNERVLSREEFNGFTGFLSDSHVEELAPFLDCDEYYCEQDQLLMLGKNGGRRVFVSSRRPPEFFAGLSREFDTLRQGPTKIRYRLEQEVPGLEILFADEDLAAQTVWTNGNELRVLVADAVKRKQIDKEIETAVEELQENAEESDEEEDWESPESSSYELEQKRRFENFEWFTYNDGRLAARAVQPPEAEFIPVRDGFTVTASNERWKSRTSSVEFRVGENGLHKIAAGKITKIKDGDYSSPVMTGNGKWVFASKYTDDDGPQLVRINVATNREFPVRSEKFPAIRAVAYVASINRILASSAMSDEEYGYEESGDLFWVDADTGIVQAAKGNFEPLTDQTFRPLQPGPGAYEHWAAVIKEKETVVGIYSTKTFKFKPVLTAPKIRFDSMDMWVDQPHNKVYFVYNGHLLSLPLTAKK